MNVIKVELNILDEMVGEQLIRMEKSQSGDDHRYFINNTRYGPESVYKVLVSAGIPPGNPYFDLFMLGDSSGAIENRLMPVWQPQKKPCGNKLFKSRVSITFDNKLRWLLVDADEVTFVKQQAQSSEFEYFINRIQCRPTDISELWTTLFHFGDPTHGTILALDIILDE